MKIMVCGKGGCGKSTLSALLAKEYAARGKQVLVVDADESNFGLYRQLGCEMPKDLAEYCGGRRGVMSTTKGADVRDELFGSRWTISDIPADYAAECDGVKMVAIGKIREAGEGCACAMGVLAKNFLPNLTLGENDIVIIDAEAGVEHFGRGVDHTVDVVLMAADPSFESIQLCEKIAYMTESIGKKFLIALNKSNAEKEDLFRQLVKDPGAIAAAIPESTEIMLQGLKGEKLTAAPAEIAALADAILA